MVVRPGRALGAPQTISLRPSLVSTWQTRSRSALGCCTASTILATEKAASLAAGFSTCSTSSPAMVMASTTCSTVASVSRCSLSQESVNFIVLRSSDPPLLSEGDREAADSLAGRSRWGACSNGL